MTRFVQCSIYETAFSVLHRAFDICTIDQCVLIGMICWNIWNRRNKWVWDKANGSAYGVCAAATNLLKDWQEAQVRMLGRNSLVNTASRLWTKPAMGWYKINVDAAVFPDGRIGVGSVIRDEQGRFMAARCRKLEGAWQPREAEALSLKEAISWAIERNYDHCVFLNGFTMSCFGLYRNSRRCFLWHDSK